MGAVYQFQFHIGAIRRARCAVSPSTPQSFNSILVQLEEGTLQVLFAMQTCFNSILVQLEVFNRKRDTQIRYRFNSILVQLEVGHTDLQGCLLSRFNSILVQLEVRLRSSACSR